MDVAADIVKEAGPRSMSCTGGNAFPATACMDRALRRREPFVHLRSGFGTDSFLSSAVVGTPGGAVVFYFTDSMGPAYKGTCLRQNVLSALAGDPICKRQLTDRVDLRTCAPYEEKHRPMYEEPWAAGCDTHAPALYAGRVIHRVPLVSDPKKWSLHCEQLSVNAVAIVEEDGSVQCARVISATKRDRPPPAGLYDEIRKNLMQWRFSPPAVYGQPLTVQWPIYEERPCAREK